MILEQNDIDLSLLKEHFTEADGYDKETILKDLESWRDSEKDFLVLIHGDPIDGFLIACRNRDVLFIHQVWHESGKSLSYGRRAMEYAKKWAKERGMKAVMFETQRKQMRGMMSYGYKEFSVILRCEL